ncbi:condensation domain-containing protein [Streptomyces sp. AGS-58]|uniref:condensation domain-containing protein n=1 Tax=unclassified Streptomyces TaxID=2593676 RepID=UPI0035A39983
MFDLSRSQEIVWLHEELFPDSRAYNYTSSLELRGPLDEEALRQSLRGVLDRHEGLRLELVPDEFPPKQRVAESYDFHFRTVDLTVEDDPDTVFEQIWREQHDTPFETTRAAMARWCLLKIGENHHRLLHTEHHLVHDGKSFSLIARDLFTLYRGLTTGIPAELPTPRSYRDHVEQSVAEAAQPDHQRESLEFWRRTLDGADLHVPLRGRVDPGRVREVPHGEQLRQFLPPEVAEPLRAVARRDGHTPYSILLTLFAEFLRRRCGQHELVIGSAVGNRPLGFDETVGMFVNTVPLRLALPEQGSALDAVDEVTETLLRALPHQSIPIQDLARALGLHSAAGLDNPMFRVMFSAHDAPLPEIDGVGLDVSIHEGYNTGTSRFDLDLVLIPDSRRTVNPRTEPGGMILVWDYASDMFDADEIAAFQSEFLAMLHAYLVDPATSLSGLSAPTHV